MKIKDWILIGAVLIIAFGIYGIAYEKGVSKQLRRQLNDKALEVEHALAKKDKEISSLWSGIEERDRGLIAVNDRLDELGSEKAKWKEDAIYWKNKAEEAPPQTLVADVRMILNTDEVWQTPDGILMSVEAFRQLSFKLYDWKDFTENREPNYIESLELYQTKVYVLTSDVADLKKIIISWSDKFDLQQSWNDELMEYLKKKDSGGFWRTVKQVGTGVAIGVTTAFLLNGVLK